MPAIVASAVRVIIQAAVQTGIFILLEKLLAPVIDAAKRAVKNLWNLTDEEAEDSIANEVIDALAMIGIIGVGIKTKLPTIAAEKLGFTSKGYAKRVLSKKIPTAVKGTGAKKAVDGVKSKILTATEATTAIEGAKVAKVGFKASYDLLVKTVGVTFMGFMVVGNWIDFGNWNNGAYQKSMQKFIAWITFGALVPDEDYRKSLTVSDEIFSKVYNTFKTGGALGIQDPWKAVEVPFTRDNLLDLTDQVGATLLLTDGSASAKKVLAATLPMIIFNTTADVDGAIKTSGGAIQKTTTQATSQPTTKVFTGIVSQGVVGAGLVFTARPDDLIESIDELRTAAANNLAPYLNTVLSKIVYEVKVVSSIITKDGFKQTGTTQRVQTGTYSNGQPKYKTVTNKFATLVVYAITTTGSRAKLTTIVLGPVDSAKLTVGQNDLRELETNLTKEVTTTNIKDIETVQTSEGNIVNLSDEAIEIKYTTERPWINIKGTEKGQFFIKGSDQLYGAADSGIFKSYLYPNQNKNDYPILETEEIIPFLKAIANNAYKRYKYPNFLNETGIGQNSFVWTIDNFKSFLGVEPGTVNFPLPWGSNVLNSTPVSATVPLDSSTMTSNDRVGAGATTLFEWYQTHGQPLPSISERSIIYEGMGLGSKNYYTGTSEQNTKLLNALKSS